MDEDNYDNNNIREDKMEEEDNDDNKEEEDAKDKEVFWCISAWVTRPEHPKGVKNEVKEAQTAWS